MIRELPNTKEVERDIFTLCEAHDIYVDWYEDGDKIVVIGYEGNMEKFNKYYDMF